MDTKATARAGDARRQGEGANFGKRHLGTNGQNYQAVAGRSIGVASEIAAGLRPYQADAVERINAEYDAGKRRVLSVAPTGAGKTLVAREVIARRRAGGVLFLAHRRELIAQTSAKLRAVGIPHGIIQAGLPTQPGE